MGEAEAREAIRQVIARTGRSLDAHEFDGYLALFTKEGRYRLEALGNEIGRRMTWLSVSRDELAALLEESPQHVHDLASRTHMIAVEEIAVDAGRAEALSSFVVFRTTPEGVTQVYAVGDYVDRLEQDIDGAWRIEDRCTRVKTRMFAAPTPMPL